MNAPTVQELLEDCARQVRSIMWDITTLDGPALAAAWPGFAAAAGAALSAVPSSDPGARLLAGRMAGPRPRPNRWGPPVDADPDRHLVAAAAALGAVADLLVRHAAPPTSARAARDGDLARRQITQVLVIGAHATALGLHEHATRLQPARAGVVFEQPGMRLAVPGATRAQSLRLASELDTLQAHGVHYLSGAGGRGPASSPESFVDPDRLPHVLAAWEVAAMRVLHASPPSVRDLAGVAHAEQALLVHAMVILDAAARAGVIDHEGFTARIGPRLGAAHRAWGAVAASWPAQMSTPAPPALLGVEASAQLHQVLGQITRDGNGWAAAPLIGRRVHLGEVSGQLRDAIAAGRARAQRFAELPGELARAGQLRTPARLLAALEPHSPRGGPQLDGGVRLTDVANRRFVTLRPEQTTGATATAADLGRQMTLLTQGLETLRLDRGSALAVEPAAGGGQAGRGQRPWRAPPVSAQPRAHLRLGR